MKTIRANNLKEVAAAMNDRIYYGLNFAKFYCIENNLHFADEVFDNLKQKVTFKHDHRDFEQFMAFPTFVENNDHGKPFYGDCDDFTIAFLTCCIALGYEGALIFSGNQKDSPTHVYAGIIVSRNQLAIYDLTESKPYRERLYKYKKVITLQV